MQNRRRRDTSHSELTSLQRTLASTERIAAHQQKLRSGDTSSLLPASRKSANEEHSRWSHEASCMALGPATPTTSLRHAQTADEPLDACLKAAAAGKEALQSRTWTRRRSDDGQRSIMTTGLTKCCLERLTPCQRLQTSTPAYKVPAAQGITLGDHLHKVACCMLPFFRLCHLKAAQTCSGLQNTGLGGVSAHIQHGRVKESVCSIVQGAWPNSGLACCGAKG